MQLWPPILDDLMDKQIVFIFGDDLLDPLVSDGTKIVINHHLSVLRVNHGIPHLPNGNRSSVKEPFNSVRSVLKVEFRPGSICRLGLKYGLLNSLICKVLFEPSIK